MARIYEGSVDGEIKQKISLLQEDTIKNCIIIEQNQHTFYRVQDNYHDGNGVFFNPNGHISRYGLIKNTAGSLYIADDPLTCLAEVFKDEEFISSSDLDTFHIAELKTLKDLRIVDLGALALKMKITNHELTSKDYELTQLLAEKLSSCADGLRYISNRSLKVCTVLWNPDITGKDMISTVVLQSLSKFELNGKTAVEMLEEELEITVVPDNI